MRDDYTFVVLVVLVFGVVIWLVGRQFFKDAKESVKRSSRRDE